MMTQSTFRRCQQLTLLALLLCVETKRPRWHYHRYLLSDYKAQHSPRVHWDYVRHTPKILKAEDGPVVAKRNEESSDEKPKTPRVLMLSEKGGKRLNLNNLIVGVFDNDKFVCYGTLLTQKLAITSHSCALSTVEGEVAVHTYGGGRHVVSLDTNGQTFDIGGDMSLLQLMVLKEPISHGPMEVKLCNRMLTANDYVILPTYNDDRMKLEILNTTVKSHDDCKELFEDPAKKLLSAATTCVFNPLASKGCKNSIGEPLIYDGRICGINIVGHNCPKAVERDIFVSLVNMKAFMQNQAGLMQRSGLDDILS